METLLKALSFDFGGTLESGRWDETRALRAARFVREELQALAVPVAASIEDDAAMLEAIVAAYDKDRGRRERSGRESTPVQFWGDVLELAPAGKEMPPASDAERLAVEFECRAWVRAAVPGGRELLSRLREREVILAIISNVMTSTRVPAALVEYGLSEFFDHVVMSSVLGVRKPDPAIFEHTASLMGIPVSAMGYVGDRINRDVLGAKRAGCGVAILFTGAGDALPRIPTGTGLPGKVERMTFPPELLRPDAVVGRLGDVVHHVRSYR